MRTSKPIIPDSQRIISTKESARNDAAIIKRKGIKSPDTSKMYRVTILKTSYFFHKKEDRDKKVGLNYKITIFDPKNSLNIKIN